MAAKRKPVAPRISEESVRAKTGRGWDEWFGELDQAGAAAWKHKQIAKHILEGYGVTHWWAQSVAVAYENARGLRDKHEMPDGYQIQRQKRIDAPVEAAWQAWADERLRSKWLPEAAAARVRSVRDDKRMIRLDWPDGTRIMAGAKPHGNHGCEAGVQQSKLVSAAAAEEAKTFWAAKLTELKAMLEASENSV